MSRNPPIGDFYGNGVARNRLQLLHPLTNRWVIRSNESGQFINVKQDESPFKELLKTR